MLKKILLLFCVCSVVVSCYQYNEPKKPEQLIKEDQMALILLDLRLIDAVSGKHKRVLDSANVTPYGYIKKKYGVDSLQFKENNIYYSYHKEEYQAIFSKVKDSITKLKEYYSNLIEKERLQKIKQDSLKQIEKDLEDIEISDELDTELIAPVSDKR